jgi:hypothetical protein
MNPILNAGLLIGVLCSAWTFVMGVTGWYKDPVKSVTMFLPAVILIEVLGLVWGLRKTAAQGRTYGGQIVAGTMMSIIAGVVIICSSLVFTMVAFPDYFQQIEAGQRAMLQQQGKTDGEIAEAIAGNAAANTPMAQAMAGFIGTLITGILASAIIGIWVRAKAPETTARV